MKNYISVIATALILGVLNLPAHALTFVSNEKFIQLDDYLYKECGEKCPSIDYKFINTGYLWLDSIINKDVVFGLSDYYEENSQEDKQWQQFKAIKNPTDKQLADQASKAIKAFIKNNSEWIKEDESNSVYSVSAIPSYIGHKHLKNNNQLEMFSISYYQYFGGAHGVPALEYYVFDMNNKKRLTLDNIILSGKKPILEKLVREAYNKYLIDNELDPQDMAEIWEFHLTENFSFDKNGMNFLYQPYEITPYVMGMPEFTIKYEDLKKVIKAEYLE